MVDIQRSKLTGKQEAESEFHKLKVQEKKL